MKQLIQVNWVHDLSKMFLFVMESLLLLYNVNYHGLLFLHGSLSWVLLVGYYLNTLTGESLLTFKKSDLYMFVCRYIVNDFVELPNEGINATLDMRNCVTSFTSVPSGSRSYVMIRAWMTRSEEFDWVGNNAALKKRTF